MRTPNLPAQESAAAKLLRDINVGSVLTPERHELDAAFAAADALATLGWRVTTDFMSSRHTHGPRHPDHGWIGITVENDEFFEWCDSLAGQAWLAGIPARVRRARRGRGMSGARGLELTRLNKARTCGSHSAQQRAASRTSVVRRLRVISERRRRARRSLGTTTREVYVFPLRCST
jgi:hypothetical protein